MTVARGAMTIGPVGLDLALTLPEKGRWAGDTLTLNGTIGDQSTNVDLARVLRDQFAGLARFAGQLIPVTFGDTPELDGWYLLGRPQIDSDGGSFGTGVFNWSCDLQRVKGSAQVLQEMRLLGAGRSNSHTFTTVRRGWYSPGVGAFGIDDGTGSVNPPTRLLRSGADGAMLVVVDNAAGTLFLSNTSAVARWYVAPGDAYAGGCRIYRYQDGFRRVVGTEMRNQPTTWSIDNTLLRVAGSATPDVAQFSVTWHDGTGYESEKTFRITTDSSWTEFGYGPMAVQVVREDVDVCGLRVYYGARNVAAGYTLDVVLRRGARHAEFKWTATGGTIGVSNAWGVKLVTGEAGTTHTSGLHATAADAGGNQYIITSPSAVTADTTNGRLRLTASASSYTFMVGAQMAGAGSGFDDFTSVVYQYFGALGTRQRAVVA